MHISRASRAALGVVTGAVLMTGCSGESAPALTRPNGTIEQVVNNADYADTIGKLALRQRIDFETSDGQRTVVYNFTDAKVSPEKFKTLIEYLIRIGHPGTLRTVNLHPNGANQTEQVEANEFGRSADEHDFLLVPPNTPLPKSFKTGAEAATKPYDAQGQTISVIRQQTKAGDPVPFETELGLPVEACQALIYESATLPADISKDPNLGQRLAQETMCNSYGPALLDAASDTPYDKYTEDAAAHLTMVYGPTDVYSLDPYTFSQNEYAAMPRT